MRSESALSVIAGLDRAAGLVRRPARLGSVRLVTVDGPSGSGKTTFAAALRARLVVDGWDTVVVTVDLLTTWDDPFGWWPQLEAELLQPLQAGQPGAIRANEWSSGEPLPGPVVPVPVPQVLVLEGVSSARLAVVDRTTVAVWVEVPDQLARLERAVRRDGEEHRGHFRSWQQAETRHYAADDTRSRADLWVDPSFMPGPVHRPGLG